MSSSNIPASAPSNDIKVSRPHFAFDNTYARLPAHFFSRVHPTPVAAPHLIHLNAALAQQLGLDPDSLATPEGVAILAGNSIATGSEPIALAYAGHQFGHFVPQLGDGRANLLGEVVARDGLRYDIQLKGSGPTPFSRRGDGRAALGPVLREYILSEAMAALGVPTTRALAAVATGEPVMREAMQPGAIFTRIAASHLRVGTFQHFAARNDFDALQTLADYAIARHYPHLASAPRPYGSLLRGVIARHASLVAQWMCLGFIHGVMNTDNTSISGETIDYGPCAFMEAFNADQVFSSIDRQGRYAYSNQPNAAHWNLTRLAEALLPLVEREEGTQEAALASAYESLAAFGPQYEEARDAGLRRKLGLLTHNEGDAALAQELLDRMASNHADFTLTFHHLCDAAISTERDAAVRNLFAHPAAYNAWALTWRRRLESEPTTRQELAAMMRQANPAFIPRNHLVEEVIQAAVRNQDYKPFEALLDVVTHPFDDRPAFERYQLPAKPEERITQTFCGT